MLETQEYVISGKPVGIPYRASVGTALVLGTFVAGLLMAPASIALAANYETAIAGAAT